MSGFSPPFPTTSPGVTRRVAHYPGAEARRVTSKPKLEGISLLTQSGVRTFLPPRLLGASNRPAHPPVSLYRDINPNSVLVALRHASYHPAHASMPARQSRSRDILFPCSSELLIHDQGIDKTVLGVLKRARQTANNLKAEVAPQFHRSVVGADHEVELRGAEAAFPGTLQGV